MKPRVGDISGENNLAVTLADQVTRGLRIRRACALGRNPRRRMAASTRARVSRLTWELEFSTREIVPMPTEAAWATSRIVVFLGTASIGIWPFVALATGWVRLGIRQSPVP